MVLGTVGRKFESSRPDQHLAEIEMPVLQGVLHLRSLFCLSKLGSKAIGHAR